MAWSTGHLLDRLIRRLLRPRHDPDARPAADPCRVETLEPRILLNGQIGPPTVEDFSVNDGAAHRSRVSAVSVRFSHDVSESVDRGDLSIRDADDGSDVDLSAATVAFDALTNTARWDFSALPGGTLPEGNYAARVSGTGIFAFGDQQLDGNGDGVGGDDYPFEVHRYFGDSDGDRDVDALDLFHYGATHLARAEDGRFDPRFDSEADGDVDFRDLFLFRLNHLTALPAPIEVSAGLSRDTARGGQTNDDRVTSDTTIRGRVSFPDAAASIRAGLDGSPVTFDLEVTSNGSFLIDQALLESIQGGSVVDDGPHTLHVAATPISDLDVIADFAFVKDSTPPEVVLSLVSDLEPVAPDATGQGGGFVDLSTFFLSPPSIGGGLVSFDVDLDYVDAEGRRLVYFGIDVSESDDALTGTSTDFSAFSFAPASSLPAAWQQIPGARFGDGPLLSGVEFETAGIGLLPGRHLLGTLSLDLNALSVDSAEEITVSILGADSVLGVEFAEGAPSAALTGPATFEFTVPGFDPGEQTFSPGRVDSPVVRVDAEPDSLVRVFVDDQEFLQQIVTGPIEVPITDLTPGPHDVRATAEDIAGNVGASNVLQVGETTPARETSGLQSDGNVGEWTGNGDGMTWEDPDNWGGQVVPGEFDDVRITSGGFEITINGDARIFGLESAADLRVTGSLTVLGTGTISGALIVDPGARVTVDGASSSLRADGSTTIDGAELDALNGGLLELPAATSFTDGIATLSGGSLDMPGLTTIDRSRFQVSGGSTFTLASGVASYSSSVGVGFNEDRTMLSADGTGTVLDLSALTTIEGLFSGFGAIRQVVTSTGGGRIDLSGVTSINAGARDGPFEIAISGDGTIDLSALATLTGNRDGILLTNPDDLPALTSASGTTIVLDAGSTPQAALLQALTDSTVQIGDGAVLDAPVLADITDSRIEIAGTGVLTAPGLTTITGARFILTSGARYTLPATLATYNGSGLGINEKRTVFSADGPGTVLDLSGLQRIDAVFIGLGALLQLVTATDGGRIDLSGLTEIEAGGSGANGGGPFEFRTDTTGAIDLSSLATITGRSSGVLFTAGSALLALPSLVIADRVDYTVPAPTSLPLLEVLINSVLTIPDTSSVSAPLLGDLDNTEVALDGSGTFDAPVLTTIARARFILTGGAQYALPASLTAYDASGGMNINEKRDVFIADGAGTVLDLSSLQRIDALFVSLGALLQLVSASNGGRIDLSGLAEVEAGGRGANGGGPFEFRAESNAIIDLPNLTRLTGQDAGILVSVLPDGVFNLGSELAVARTRVDIADGASLIATRLTLEEAATLSGAGVLTGEVTGAGTIAPDGRLTVDGPVAQSTDGRIEIGIGGTDPGTGHDVLAITGVADLNGTFAVALTGGFVPAIEASFDVVAYASRLGAFAVLEGLDPGSGIEFVPFIESDRITLVVAAAMPPPDLAVTAFAAEQMTIGDPASIDVSYTVENQGLGNPRVDNWDDAIVLSTDDVVGNGDDVIGTRFARTTGLDAGEGYSRNETILLPAGLVGTFHVFLVADIDGDLIKETERANNVLEAPEMLTVIPIPYADLVVDSVTAPATGASGQPLGITWQVSNRGLGQTDVINWGDTVHLSTDSAGVDRIATLGELEHLGHLGVGDGYTRTATFTLPDGLAGTFYVVVASGSSGGPFEFTFDDNNTGVSTAVDVALSPTADLELTSVTAPPVAEEGAFIDVSWTVSNIGAGDAEGADLDDDVEGLRGWRDVVYLRATGDPNAEQIEIGSFAFTGTLAAGATYSRLESLRLPDQINGQFDVTVVTDFDGAVFEDGAVANNARTHGTPLSVTVMPRPDLQVAGITVPVSAVNAGGAVSVEYEIINQGTVTTPAAGWVDRVYLSLDTEVTGDDILISEVPNAASLAPGEQYLGITGSVEVPLRFRGEVFVLVFTDADGAVDEWPNDQNNVAFASMFVNPLPFADLVTSDVIVPAQAVAGEQITVRYTVTNLGAGVTSASAWTDSIWLTVDRNRPHPGEGDFLLATVDHDGALPVDGGYDEQQTVTIPGNLDSGLYYITPWSDTYAIVLEDTLAANVNPDDPNEIDNNNYKAAAIDVIGALPDLVVTEVTIDPGASAGATTSIAYTVRNRGAQRVPDGSWVDRIYLSNEPDPLSGAARSLMLAEVTRDGPLETNAEYAETVDVLLSPSARGQFIVVVSDDQLPEASETHQSVKELDEANNQGLTAVDITPLDVDLVVSDVQFEPSVLSGETTTVRYTLTNVGTDTTWDGGQYHIDFIWLSADPQFIRLRSSYLGANVVALPQPLGPGESYEVTYEATMPPGTDGDYYLHIHMDAHNDLSPLFFPTLARIVRTGWWPAETGRNDDWLDEFRRWAYEDPTNNLSSWHVPITYREADLRITTVAVPPTAAAGETIDVDYTVRNEGTRATRADEWTDRLFLSRDPSLDNRDLELALQPHRGTLDVDETYDATLRLRLPEGIEGDFHLLLLTDAWAFRDRFGLQPTSDIGFGLPGVDFEDDPQLFPWDLASEAQRVLARGDVDEYQDEADNLLSIPLPVTAVDPPDLQVTDLVAPLRAENGRALDFEYTVANLGGDTPASQRKWSDLVYLSRDALLDTGADLFLAELERNGGLAGSDSYTVVDSVQVPTGISGGWFLFVVTDPPRTTVIGDVFEGANERNNDRASAVPVIIELPPPTDLEVTDIVVPGAASAGEEIEIEWTVTNTSGEPVTGAWFDAVYASADAVWDVGDRPLGRLAFDGTLAPGASYTSTFETRLAPITPGPYRVIVRTDIFDVVHEEIGETNNSTTSPQTMTVTAPTIELGVPRDLRLSTGDEKLFGVVVPQDQTLRVTLTASDNRSVHELFVRHLEAPTSARFDAAYEGGLSSNLVATAPDTQAGEYFVLVRAHAEPNPFTRVTLLAELLPLAITAVHSDVGGDGVHVTTTIDGARFHPDAIVKLVRPGFEERDPVVHDVVSSAKIIATFDLAGAPLGLYDVKVINPDGEEAIVPYRFLVERAIEPEVTIGVGGPRAILAGDTGTYSVALSNLGNLDAPYVFFEVGIPELGHNRFVYGLPYLDFTSNVRGGPTVAALADVPFAELDSAVNTTGDVLAPGYLFDQHAQGFTGVSFNVSTYPGLRELYERAFEELREKLYGIFPIHRELGTLDDGPQNLDAIFPGLKDLFFAVGGIPDDVTQVFIPFQFHVVASATAMTRAEFVEHTVSEAITLRAAILEDPGATPALLAIAADPQI